MVEGCDIRTEPGTTYEDAHRVMERHYRVHIIEELRGIRRALEGQGVKAADFRQREAGPPLNAVPVPVASPGEKGDARPVSGAKRLHTTKGE